MTRPVSKFGKPIIGSMEHILAVSFITTIPAKKTVEWKGQTKQLDQKTAQRDGKRLFYDSDYNLCPEDEIDWKGWDLNI